MEGKHITPHCTTTPHLQHHHNYSHNHTISLKVFTSFQVPYATSGIAPYTDTVVASPRGTSFVHCTHDDAAGSVPCPHNGDVTTPKYYDPKTQEGKMVDDIITGL